MTAVNHPDAQKWNKRFEQDRAAWLANQPRPLLVKYARLLPTSGLALAAAAGVGTNGLFLARHGLHVIALDISEVGLRLARAQAQEQALNLETAVFDLTNPWLPRNQFDVIINFRFLQRATFPVYKQALKPGGWLIFETLLQQDTAVAHPQFYLKPSELQQAFIDFELIHYLETAEKKKNVAQLVARKPI